MIRTPRVLAALLLAALIVPAAVSGAPLAGYFSYAGTTSQHEPFHFVLTRTAPNTYRLLASWYDRYSPAVCNQTLGRPSTTLKLAGLHITNSAITISGATPQGGHTALPHRVSLKAVFTKGKVSGSFTDTTGHRGQTGPTVACSTGVVTFTAVRA